MRVDITSSTWCFSMVSILCQLSLITDGLQILFTCHRYTKLAKWFMHVQSILVLLKQKLQAIGNMQCFGWMLAYTGVHVHPALGCVYKHWASPSARLPALLLLLLLLLLAHPPPPLRSGCGGRSSLINYCSTMLYLCCTAAARAACNEPSFPHHIINTSQMDLMHNAHSSPVWGPLVPTYY